MSFPGELCAGTRAQALASVQDSYFTCMLLCVAAPAAPALELQEDKGTDRQTTVPKLWTSTRGRLKDMKNDPFVSSARPYPPLGIQTALCSYLLDELSGEALTTSISFQPQIFFSLLVAITQLSSSEWWPYFAHFNVTWHKLLLRLHFLLL